MKARIVFAFVLTSLVCVPSAGASTYLKPNPNGPDKFSFHGQVWSYGLNPSQKSFEIRVTNSHPDAVYSVSVPRGACVDRGRSCVFRDKEAARRRQGLVEFKVLYDTGTSPDGHLAGGGHGNKFWVRSYGEFVNPNEAVMTLRIIADDRPYASFTDTFTPLKNNGWWSSY